MNFQGKKITETIKTRLFFAYYETINAQEKFLKIEWRQINNLYVKIKEERR